MKIVMASLESVSPYSFSRPYERNVPKEDKEGPDDYEKRTWRERCHYDRDGRLFIPPTAYKECIATAARYLSVQIPGRGKTTYTKHFVAGILVQDGITLPMTKEEVEGEWLYLNADGRKGGSRRVWRCMPKVPAWTGVVAFNILDETITTEVFRYHLEQAGAFIGIGRFRPEKGGFYGRFVVKDLAEMRP